MLDLVAGDADVAIRSSRQIADERLICTRLTKVRSTLFASRGYAARHGLPSSPDAFAGQD